MRHMISGVLAALAAVSASAAPALACGFSPCAQTYVPAYGYFGCAAGCGAGWTYGRLAEPTTQYYYVNQGPTYTGPGLFAPYPTYHEGAGVEGPTLYGYRWHGHPYHWHSYRYGYVPYHPSPRYGYMPYYHGHRVVRRSY